ncbi:MAG: hypothetical protein GY820_02630 [Gammaproteobacteria bacterium]|nr:hypothetical protein [Gammaproteobacteria bacterium]
MFSKTIFLATSLALFTLPAAAETHERKSDWCSKEGVKCAWAEFTQPSTLFRQRDLHIRADSRCMKKKKGGLEPVKEGHKVIGFGHYKHGSTTVRFKIPYEVDGKQCSYISVYDIANVKGHRNQQFKLTSSGVAYSLTGGLTNLVYTAN